MRLGKRDVVSGTVVQVTPYKEACMLVTLATAHSGLVVCSATAARNSRKRFGGVLDKGCDVELVLQRQGPYLRALEAKLHNARLGLRTDLERLNQAHILFALAKTLLVPDDPQPQAYNAFVQGLDACARGDTAQTVRWSARLLYRAGLFANPRRCSICNQPHTQPPCAWAEHFEGFVCAQCAGTKPHNAPTKALWCLLLQQQADPDTAWAEFVRAACALTGVRAPVYGRSFGP